MVGGPALVVRKGLIDTVCERKPNELSWNFYLGVLE